MPSLVIVMHIVCYGFIAFRPSRPNRNLAKLMGVMKKHDVTNKNTIQENNSLLWIQSDPSRPNWNFAKLMGVMKKHDLTNKNTTTKTNSKTTTKTITFREYLQRAIFETFDLWDIWSGWWENMTWPTKRQRRRQRQWQRKWQIHLENTFKEQSLRLLTFKTEWQ